MFGRAGVNAKLGFDGAESSGRHGDWEVGSGRTADEYHRRQGGRLRARSRDLARNDLLAQSILRTLSIAAYGVRPHADTGDANLDRDVDALWDEWARQASSSTYHGFDGMIQLMIREFLTAGGAMMRARARRPEDGLVVPLQLELLPVDLLVTELDRDLPSGGRIVQGVQLDPLGRIEGYHLWTARQGVGKREQVYVPETVLAHLHDPTEIGMCRGTPWLSHAMVAIRDLQLLGDAQRTRAVGESSFMGVVVTPDDQTDGPYTGAGTTSTEDGETVITEGFTPGTWASLRAGQDIRFHTPSGSSFDAMRVSEMAQIAAASGATYEQVSGDLSRTNWTSYRAGQIQHRALVRWMQEELLVPMVLRRVWVWWLDSAVASGILPEAVRARRVQVTGGGSFTRAYPVRWELPAFGEVDQAAEAKGITLMMRAGLTTYEHEIQKQGLTPEQVYDSMARTVQALRERGLALDSIPSMTTSSGQVQAVPVEPPERHAQP